MRDRRAENSLRPLDFLIHGCVVLVNHVELCGEAEETLGVSHEKIAFRIQTAIKLVDQPFLLGLIKVNNHVAADNPSSDCENRTEPNFSGRASPGTCRRFFRNSAAGRCNPRSPSALRCKFPAAR